jgi:uncharacterized protein
MIVYFDTSAIVPIVIEEPSSPSVTRLWDEADRVVSSRLLYAEGRAALAMAYRRNRLDRRGLRAGVQEFESVHDQLDIVEITEQLVREAGVLAERFGLRGYDAVHLASAQLVDDPEMVFAAGDRDLVGAAQRLRITTANLTKRS